MKRQSSALSLCILMLMLPLSGCILDMEFKGELVGTFEIDSLGTGTTNVNDTIISIELINSSVNQIQFNDDTGNQDGSNHFRFRIVRDIYNDTIGPSFECRIQTQSPSDCLIVESVDDGIWEIGEIITLQENDVDICSSGCQIQLTILNGDIITEEEENLQYLGQKAIGGSPIRHTTNFGMGQ
tara:strand:+ start:24 stop:572 length:549 start_codon:yes stop_codon:yes gene_type:complete